MKMQQQLAKQFWKYQQIGNLKVEKLYKDKELCTVFSSNSLSFTLDCDVYFKYKDLVILSLFRVVFASWTFVVPDTTTFLSFYLN